MIDCIKTGWPALLTWTRATFSSLILSRPGSASAVLGICPHRPESLEHEACISRVMSFSQGFQGSSDRWHSMWGGDALLTADAKDCCGVLLSLAVSHSTGLTWGSLLLMFQPWEMVK